MIRNSLFGAASLSALLFGFAWTTSVPVSLASQSPEKVETAKEKAKAPSQTKEASAPKADKKDPFPLRKKYPQLKCLGTEEFAAMRKSAIVIDARNSVEFDVIQVEGAINVPATTMKRKTLLKIRAATAEQPIIFYCNGVTCTKSYKGGEKARSFGFNNIFVYDAGVMDWATSHSSETVFFGKPMDAKTAGSKIISKET
ncbi:MAG: rhodanese-like domain-containing protein, partial [Planctomycetota bacterium]|nr:rhodanese-like domain-containing protein [Planctomycetota bacterium]